MGIMSMLAFACAVSLDGFSAGMTYGVRGIKLPTRSVLIVSFCSASAMFLSMYIGRGLSSFISPSVAETIGGMLIVFIGMYAVYQIYREKKREQCNEEDREYLSVEERRSLLKLEIKALGLIVEVLKHPAEADVNRSGNISGKEAFILGLALAIDACGSGIGAAFLGYTPWLTALFIAIVNGIFIVTGIRVGAVYAQVPWLNRMTYLPGMLLILYGMVKIW
jgi:putative sporulation protein YtaF